MLHIRQGRCYLCVVSCWNAIGNEEMHTFGSIPTTIPYHPVNQSGHYSLMLTNSNTCKLKLNNATFAIMSLAQVLYCCVIFSRSSLRIRTPILRLINYCWLLPLCLSWLFDLLTFFLLFLACRSWHFVECCGFRGRCDSSFIPPSECCCSRHRGIHAQVCLKEGCVSISSSVCLPLSV